MNNRAKRAAGLLALAALAFPAVAAAERGEHADRGSERSQERRHDARPWNVRGVVTAKGEETVTVKINHSNRFPRVLRGREVTFDVSDARILVRDVNGDGENNLADVSVGDRAGIKARLPRRPALESGQAVPARLGIFRAPRPPEEPATEQPAPELES